MKAVVLLVFVLVYQQVESNFSNRLSTAGPFSSMGW